MNILILLIRKLKLREIKTLAPRQLARSSADAQVPPPAEAMPPSAQSLTNHCDTISPHRALLCTRSF